ncbi:carboxymuconolactone decarboxylase family protein [Poritiphilus flavus]|uniref:Peroxidase-related enzyme n=1 Tax=Poritiphilus flavus TaxID=2697053 RepID=A0A6L9E932_9FLAO|nr:peroxidase-related enzyme [Poritiphilus flavus]NAS11287.1 peroxidase-related enzyme [Poritiphilus flavus]
MSWIKTISYKQADPELKRVYKRVLGPQDSIDNVLKIHSLRPHTLIGHMTLYKSVLHHSANSLPKWYLESLGVYVSRLNQCDYCVQHHSQGLKRLLERSGEQKDYLGALNSEKLEDHFSPKQIAGLNYARLLTLNPDQLSSKDIKLLHESGFDDGEILEINQLVSYFNYVNRTVLGLGVNLKGDILGLSPGDSEDPENWNHQ